MDYTPGPGRHRGLAAAVLIPRRCATTATTSPTSSRVNPTLRAGCATSRLFVKGGAPARPQGDPRAGDQPHLRPAPLVPARPPTPSGGSKARDFYVWSDDDKKWPETRIIFSRHGDLQLDLGSGRPSSTTGTGSSATQPDLNFDNPQVVKAVDRGDALLAWDMGVERAAPGRDPLPGSNRGRHQQREICRRPTRSSSGCARRWMKATRTPFFLAEANHVAGGHAALFRRRRRMPDVVPLPADAADVHGDGPRRIGNPVTDIMRQTPDIPANCQWGHLPAQPRRADAGDGGPTASGTISGTSTPREKAGPGSISGIRRPAGAADGERPAQDRAAEQPAVLDARHADPLLRRRDRHGRQLLPGRPGRGAHADAVVAGTATADFSKADPARLYLPPVDGPDLRASTAVNVEAAAARLVVAC